MIMLYTPPALRIALDENNMAPLVGGRIKVRSQEALIPPPVVNSSCPEATVIEVFEGPAWTRFDTVFAPETLMRDP